MIIFKLLILITGVAMIGSALVALAMLWPFILIIYGILIGSFLIQWATNNL